MRFLHIGFADDLETEQLGFQALCFLGSR